MASEDIIELGSSDDEAEPAPKKTKPNAMVHIPRKFPGVSIEPAKPTLPSLHKKFSGRPITIKKIPNNHVPTEVKNNRNALRKPLVKPIVIPVQKPKQALNPISVKMTKSQVAINRVPAIILKEPIKIPPHDGHRPFNALPPSITIKKTMPSNKYVNAKTRNKINKHSTILPKAIPPFKGTGYPNPLTSKCSVSNVNTLNLVEVDTNPASVNPKGPQWYLRPEEQQQGETIEEQNNTEPKSSTFIEITIEDSPVKPVSSTHEIGAEFAITIEDSPIRFADNKDISNCSDEENKVVQKIPKTKKKLEYPKDNIMNTTKTVEIEIEPMVVNVDSEKINTVDNKLESKPPKIIDKNEDEVPVKKNSTEETAQPKKLDTQTNVDIEFHPVYQSFIDLCFELENSEDMQKIMEKKIKGYYRQVPKEYRESDEFLEIVSSKMISMKAGPERMFLYIKDVVDELNFKRKSCKTSAPPIQETNDKEAEKFFYGEESEFDSKRQRQIRKLEKTLKKLHRAIQKLEEQEVDFDDEEDSVYLLTERYKERMIRVHAKFCQLTNTKMPSEPRIHIEARPGQPAGPAKRLEKMINKKVPIGKPLPFPDFHDVLRCVREANEEDKLCWNEADILDEARDLFTRCGKKLQRRRQENEWRLAASRISAETDPAADSDDLRKKLEHNKLLAVKNETELYNKFADKQNQMKLEAVEIGDKEAEESPVESEDDDIQEVEAPLENSERRKERLKRLIHEKTTNSCEQNMDQSTSSSIKESKSNDIDEKEKLDVDKKEEEYSSIKIQSVMSLSETIDNDDKVQSLSDDSSKINSDIDELNLLRKLHSETEVNNSSDSDSLIAISDSLDSGSDSKNQGSDDVISIENSSYSEAEVNEDENVLAVNYSKLAKQENVKEAVYTAMECSATVATENKLDKSNNNEYNESLENILLASSSDEECGTDKNIKNRTEDTYVYLKGDTISTGETFMEGIDINETLVRLGDEEKSLNGALLTSDNTSDKIKQQEIVLNVNQIDSSKETNVSSAIDDDSVNADVTFTTVRHPKNKEAPHKESKECDSLEETVGSGTEAMEVVTTTPPCDSVNC